MNKKELVEYLEEKKEYLDIMQKDFGNDSWWYSNRNSDNCIYCKIHAWVDTSKVLALLSEKERATIELLGIDIDTMCNDIVWGGDYCFSQGLVGYSREDVLEYLQEKYPEVVNITYHGRQGGWACIQYSFDIRSSDDWTLEDNLHKVPLKDLRELKKQVQVALLKINAVTVEYQNAYKELCNSIKDPMSYVYNIQERISGEERCLLGQLEKKIELSEKLKAL